MAKQLIKQIDEHAALYRDNNTGLAWVEDGRAGCSHSCHPNIDETGSVKGMKDRGYWAKDCKTLKSHGWIYNVSRVVVSDDLDELARKHCRCGGVH